MKEEEAEAKWCPMVRIGDMNQPTGLNRGYKSNNKCIASNCMMWIESDNEGVPSNNEEDEVTYYPAGDCGLKNRCFQ